MSEINIGVKRLLEISSRKKKLAEELFRLTSEQRESISENNIEGIKNSVGNKQRIIDNIDNLDKRFNQRLDELKTITGCNSVYEIVSMEYEYGQELMDSINDILGLMSKIRNMEKNNNRNLLFSLKSTEKIISDIRLKKNVRNRYIKAYNEAQSYFIDKKN